MTYWKKLFSKHLIETGHVLNIHLKQLNVKNLIDVPHTFHTEREMLEFSKEIKNSIRFPHLRYLSNSQKKKIG